jgi:hypothetical protein
MTLQVVPDFFQMDSESALRRRAGWMEENLDLGTRFLASLLGETEEHIRAWRDDASTLSPDRRETLKGLWEFLLHLLSTYDSNFEAIRGFLEAGTSTCREACSSPLSPPWKGMSLKMYLEQEGADGIHRANRWIMANRFGELQRTTDWTPWE